MEQNKYKILLKMFNGDERFISIMANSPFEAVYKAEKLQNVIYAKEKVEHPTEAEVSKEEETHNLLLADCLSKYIYDKHTQEECIGFIDGFEEAQEKDKVLISELIKELKYVSNKISEFKADNNSIKWNNSDNSDLKKIIIKAEKYVNNE